MHITQSLHLFILFTSVVKNDLLYNLVAANLFNVYGDVHSRLSVGPITLVCCLFFTIFGARIKVE
jgi:hypothetical protein